MKKLSFVLLVLQFSIHIYARHSKHHLSGMHHHTREKQSDDTEFGDENFRIVNGSLAARSQFPWAAAVMTTPYNKDTGDLDYSNGGDFRRQSCGASILSQKFLLTAAHCFFVAAPLTEQRCRYCCNHYYDCEPVYNYAAKDINVIVGMLSAATIDGSNRWHHVEKIYIPDRYNRKTLANDVGLIQLSDQSLIQYTYNPRVASIDVLGYYIEADTSARICGWGKNCHESLQESDKKHYSQRFDLKYIDVTTTEFENCSTNFLLHGKDDDNVICAGGINKNVGQGDSGGGLVIRNGNRNYLIGVVSTIIICGHTKPGWVPSVFTRLSTFYGWIDNIVSLRPKTNVNYAYGGQDYDTKDDNDHSNPPDYMGPYNSPQSMGLWQWIHMYPGLSNGMFPEENSDIAEEPNSNDDDDTIKHKEDFNMGPFGGESAWEYQLHNVTDYTID